MNVTVPIRAHRPECAAPGGRGRSRRERRAGWLALTLLASSSSGAGAVPILHEYVELGPGPDAVAPPGTPERPSATAVLDPSTSKPTVSPRDAPSYRVDRDTRRAQSVSYDDPFTPSVAPFKRSAVYDAVSASGDLIILDRSFRPVPNGSRGSDEEHFHAVFDLDLEAGRLEALPSVAPGARVIVLHQVPPRGVELGMDSAENWYARSERSGTVTLSVQLAVDRQAFSGHFQSSTWGSLEAHLPPVPESVRREALSVAQSIGVHRDLAPDEAFRRLVHHFRRFRPSPRMPTSHGLALYRELALTARGICRHRSYAFVVTALGLGIPARLALNEAHAWVEVRDRERWHRIDLGGAAEDVHLGNPDRPRHVAPRDPIEWPASAESGLSMLDGPGAAEGGGQGTGARDSAPGAPQPGQDPSASGDGLDPAGGDSEQPAPNALDPSLAAPAGPRDPASSPTAPELSPDVDDAAIGRVLEQAGVRAEEQSTAMRGTTVWLEVERGGAERGRGLSLTGRVERRGRPCVGAAVEVELLVEGRAPSALGRLVTDGRGHFSGRLVIPWQVPVGEHSLSARVTNDESCAR